MKSKNFFSKFRSYFLTGLVVTAPLGLTIYLAIIFINLDIQGAELLALNGFKEGLKNINYIYFFKL